MGNGRSLNNKFMAEWKTVALMVLVVVVLQIVLGVAIYYIFGSWGDRGSFGDMFGAVNTLFSGLALAGVVYAIILQSRELALQREELSMTREELKRAADAQQASTEFRKDELSLIKKQHAAQETARANEVAPELELIDVTESPDKILVTVFNRGGSMTSAQITEAPPGAKARIEPIGSILRGSEGRLVLSLIDDTHRSLPFKVSFKDERESKRTLKINCDPWRRQMFCEVLPEDDCYLTSACVAHAGLTDDCYELTVMRAFRDDYLMTSVPGVALVSRYYRHAPNLLAAIRSSPDSDETMEWILQQVRETIRHYKDGRRTKALETYLDMIIALETEFQVAGRLGSWNRTVQKSKARGKVQ